MPSTIWLAENEYMAHCDIDNIFSYIGGIAVALPEQELTI